MGGGGGQGIIFWGGGGGGREITSLQFKETNKVLRVQYALNSQLNTLELPTSMLSANKPC